MFFDRPFPASLVVFAQLCLMLFHLRYQFSNAFLQLVRTLPPVPVACSVPVGKDRFSVQDFSSVPRVLRKCPVQLHQIRE